MTSPRHASDCAPCSTGSRRDQVVIYACSGAADVGEIGDRAARRLHARGVARMDCTAAICARVTKRATLEKIPLIFALNGCHKDCASKLLEFTGLKQVCHVRVTDLGLEKGATAVTDAVVERVVEHCRQVIEGVVAQPAAV